MSQYDYIVIGAGSACCVVANRLTEDSNTIVLLLEAGNPDTKPEIQIPSKCLSLLGSEVDWSYFSEPEPHLNDRKMFCSRGKVLGGSGSINFMMYVRGNHHDYDHWQELGNLGWSYQDVLPYFKKSEHQQREASKYHGVGGELSIIDIKPLAAVSQRSIDANAFDEFRGQEIAPGANVQSDEALEAYIRDICSTVWHPVGTCKVGTDLRTVVDPEL